uniref:Uncharacterized protein n=1 Tax=Oryza punctata TaxID=4537 RepID=A0A0E0KLS4_ORYPU
MTGAADPVTRRHACGGSGGGEVPRRILAVAHGRISETDRSVAGMHLGGESRRGPNPRAADGFISYFADHTPYRAFDLRPFAHLDADLVAYPTTARAFVVAVHHAQAWATALLLLPRGRGTCGRWIRPPKGHARRIQSSDIRGRGAVDGGKRAGFGSAMSFGGQRRLPR